MTRKRIAVSTGAWALCAVLAGHGASVGAQTLPDELRGLLDTHPRIQSKQNTVSASEEGVGVAYAGYLPTVRLTGEAGPEYVDSPTRRTTEGKAYDRASNSVGLVVTQRLFDGWSTESQVDAARLGQTYAANDLRDTRQSTMLAGAKAYINVLRYQELIKLAHENELKVQDQMHLEDERVQKGAGIASDVLAAKQRLQMAKEARVDFEGRFANAAATYLQLFGHAPNVAAFSDPPLPSALIPPQLADAVDTATRNHPSVEMAKQNVAIAEARHRTAESGYMPNVDLVGRANYENDANAIVGVRRDWSVMLTASWELFSGFKTQSQVAQAAYTQAAAKDNELYANRAVSEATRTAWNTLDSARQRTALLENAAVLAEEVWANARKAREAGKATVRDVLDEEMRINDARIKYTNAYYDMIQATYELLAAMGKMDLENVEQARPAQKSSVLGPMGGQNLAQRPAQR